MNYNLSRSVLLFLVLIQFVAFSYGQWASFGVLDQDKGFDQARINAMDDWQQKPSSLQLFSTTFDPQEMSSLWTGLLNIWNSNKIPIISWDPWFLQAHGTPSNIEVLIANGDYDVYIIKWSSQLKSFVAGADGKLNTADDRRVYIRFAHEFNGNWFPWSANAGESSPADYIAMWKRVTDLVMTGNGLSSSHVQWIWSGINQDASNGFKLEDYYPGNDFVDWVGVSGFNWGSAHSVTQWFTPVDLFAQILPRLQAVSGDTKPIAITEYASVSDGFSSKKNDEWLLSMFDFVTSNQIKMLVYQNVDKREGQGADDADQVRDWAVFGGSNGDENFNFNGRWFKGYSNYRKVIGSNPYFVGSDLSNPQLLENSIFFGTRKTNPTADSNQPTPNPFVVFSDSTVETPDYWGHNGMRISINQEDLTAPEGHNTIQVWTTGWGGFGFFGQLVDASRYESLQFHLKSTAPVKIEIRDASGRSYPIYQSSTDGVWKLVKIPLNEFMAVNKSKIVGSFMATMEDEGYFAVDNIQYV